MKKVFFPLMIIFHIVFTVNSQVQLKVYHGANGETQVYDESNKQVSKPIIRMRQGETFTVKVVNPNPILYKYSLKYETLLLESNEKEISELLTVLGNITSSRPSGFVGLATDTKNYKDAIDYLTKDINKAKEIIRNSDKPETPENALNFERTGGFRFALDEINQLSFEKFHFNSSTLLNDLNELSDKAANNDDMLKESFRLLNSGLIGKVAEIKKQTNQQTTKTIWENEFKVSDTTQKISILISRADKTNLTLTRDGNSEKDFELIIATIEPYFKRSVLELVPVAVFIFSKNVKEFYLEDDIVQMRNASTTTTKAGAILNVNFARFGESKEMAVGIGPGYKLNSNSDAFENLFISSLFSYKEFIRIGFGFGFAQFPSDQLNYGAKIGQPLPNNISNLNELIKYEEKPSAFITLSFTGLNLSKKK